MNKLFLTLLMTAVAGGAQIEWKQTEATLHVHPTQTSADAVFEFTNAGDEAISFSDIQVTCGCLSATPLQPSYAPGETGRLIVRLNLKNRYGKQRKRVFAHTLDGQKTELTVLADIPHAFTLKSPLIDWSKGDDSTEKRIVLRNPNGIPIRLLSIASSNELLPAELETIQEGFEYEVVVHRNPGAVNVRTVIRIRTEPPPGQVESKSIKLYVSVL